MSDCRFGVSPVNYPDPDPNNRLNRDRVDREAIGYGSNRGRVDRVLIGKFFFIPTKLGLYTIVFRSKSTATQPTPYHFPMVLERLASRSLLEFFEHVENFRVGSQSDAEQARVDLIGSGNLL